MKEYWDMAERHVPIAVVGGGRWGRTWLRVIANARGASLGLTIVARTDASDVRLWLKEQADLCDTVVVNSIGEIQTTSLKSVAAIIASRPKDHVRDGLEALDAELHLLVEKPISHDASQARQLYAAAQNRSRIFAIGTEFAFLPAFHVAANLYASRGDRPLRVSLQWDDANCEHRHGGVKRHHEETNVLVDLLAHAISIFRIFSSATALHITSATLSDDGNSGILEICDDKGARFGLRCNRSAAARRRTLEIAGTATSIAIDFSENPSSFLIDGQTYAISDDLLTFSSTLRLELGAFLSQIAGLVSTNPISAGLPELLILHDDLERKLLRKA